MGDGNLFVFVHGGLFNDNKEMEAFFLFTYLSIIYNTSSIRCFSFQFGVGGALGISYC